MPTVLLAGLVAAGLPATPAHAGGDEARLLAEVNAARHAARLPAYAPRPDLAAVARQHAAQMAASTSLYHDSRVRTRVPSWSLLGDNVGEGASPRKITRAFLASPSHRANILDRGFTEVGIGAVRDADGQLWVTEIFRRPARA
ncbi:MAG TPA: CAP domain-containing protein [Mycobacteriales bacterium]|nr:CAP domain-containing protein [Mycobacteriales bacterium]